MLSESLEGLVKAFVQQGYTYNQAVDTVNKMFGGLDIEVADVSQNQDIRNRIYVSRSCRIYCRDTGSAKCN